MDLTVLSLASFAVIVQNPFDTVVTLPFLSTFATLLLLEDQITLLFVSSLGVTVATSLVEIFLFVFARVRLFLLKLILPLTIGIVVGSVVVESDEIGSATA